MENVTSVKDKFKILFIDGESLFNFIYTTYIHTNWENKDNSLNPLLNYLFKIIYRTPNLDNYYYSYDNFLRILGVLLLTMHFEIKKLFQVKY